MGNKLLFLVNKKNFLAVQDFRNIHYKVSSLSNQVIILAEKMSFQAYFTLPLFKVLNARNVIEMNISAN